MKIEDLDENTNNNEVQLIETSNEMFQMDEENGVTIIIFVNSAKTKTMLI